MQNLSLINVYSKLLEKQLETQNALAKDELQRLRLEVKINYQEEPLVEDMQEILSASNLLGEFMRKKLREVNPNPEGRSMATTIRSNSTAYSRPSPSRKPSRTLSQNVERSQSPLPTGVNLNNRSDAQSLILQQDHMASSEAPSRLSKDAVEIFDRSPPSESPIQETSVEIESLSPDPLTTRPKFTGWVICDDGHSPVHEVHREWRSENLPSVDVAKQVSLLSTPAADEAENRTRNSIPRESIPRPENEQNGWEGSREPQLKRRKGKQALNEDGVSTNNHSPTSSNNTPPPSHGSASSTSTSQQGCAQNELLEKSRGVVDIFFVEDPLQDNSAASEEASSGPYRPVAPFGGPGGKKRPNLRRRAK